MKRIIVFSFLIHFFIIAFSQTKQSLPSSKYIIKISPEIKVSWATSKKLTQNNLNTTKLITGLNANLLFSAKKNNYNDIGLIIGIIPVKFNKGSTASFSGMQLGVEYSYRIVYLVKNKPNINFFTAVGTQSLYTQTKSLSNKEYGAINTSKSFEQNAVFTPGLQYSNNHFFLDFSIPASFGYSYLNYTKQGNSPVSLKDTQRYNLFNWNIGCKIGIGAKF